MTMWETKVSLFVSLDRRPAFMAGVSDLWGRNVETPSTSPGDDLPLQQRRCQPDQQRTTSTDQLTGLRAGGNGRFVQDKWEHQAAEAECGPALRLILHGLRPFHLGPDVFAPTRDVSFPDTPWYDFKDLSPRIGAAYDLFGTGRTAVKASINRYQLAVFPLDGIVTRDRLVNRVFRSWIDANNNFTPDCDLVNRWRRISAPPAAIPVA
jgi:hypothetical protein